MKRIKFTAEVDVTHFAYEEFKNVIDAYRFDEGIDYNKLRPIDIINEEVICNDEAKKGNSIDVELSDNTFKHLKFKEFLIRMKNIGVYEGDSYTDLYFVKDGKILYFSETDELFSKAINKDLFSNINDIDIMLKNKITQLILSTIARIKMEKYLSEKDKSI